MLFRSGTEVAYATNATLPLLSCDGAFYLCQDGAWFKAAAATGPWSLCDSVPARILQLPPSCPVYGVRFVRVIGSDAESVTFSITAGYFNSFVNDGIVSYGTGYAVAGTSVPGAGPDGAGTPVDGATWGQYAGFPFTYGYPMSHGWTGWTCDFIPGWGDYGLQCGPSWASSGWWGPGRAFGVGFALDMGFGGAWHWGHHPWGWRDGDGWWSSHWSGAYRRG